MLTHNWWHTALFALEFDRPTRCWRCYDQQVWGVARDYSQDQIGAVSLLARLELAGVDVGPRWQDVADHLARRGVDLVLPFWTCSTSTGLARAGRPQADTLLASSKRTPYSRGQAPSGAVALPPPRPAGPRPGRPCQRLAPAGQRPAAHAGGGRQPRAARPVRADPPRCAGAPAGSGSSARRTCCQQRANANLNQGGLAHGRRTN